jgi:16S rRNA processing protein RimM
LVLNDDTLIALGLIQKPRGLMGELLVKPYQANSKSFRRGLPVVIKTSKTSFHTKIESVNNSSGRFWLRLENVNDRDTAQLYAGGEILCEFAELPKTNSDEYYVFDLIGLKIVDSQEKEFGVVKDVLTMPANDVLAVETDNGEILIPFIKSAIKSVKTDKGRIEINNIDDYLTHED